LCCDQFQEEIEEHHPEEEFKDHRHEQGCCAKHGRRDNDSEAGEENCQSFTAEFPGEKSSKDNNKSTKQGGEQFDKEGVISENMNNNEG